jgi:hypothetical protein
MAPMGVAKFLGRVLIFFFILTVIGQLRWNGQSIENYYHRAVNSSSFQSGWATLTSPFRWVGERFGVVDSSTAR